MILLSDANVLIDLAYVSGIDVLPRIAATEVLDVVLDECVDDRQPDIAREIQLAGIKVVKAEASWRTESSRFRSAALSVVDTLNLYYAHSRGRILLGADKALRTRAEREGVEVHGSLWVVEEALSRGLRSAADLCDWLARWSTIGSRLPAPEVGRLRLLLGC